VVRGREGRVGEGGIDGVGGGGRPRGANADGGGGRRRIARMAVGVAKKVVFWCCSTSILAAV